MAKRVIEVVVAGDTAGLKRALGSAGRDLNRFGRQASVHGAVLARQRQTLGEIGNLTKRAAQGLGVAAVAAIGAAVKVGVEYEKEMSRVKAVIGANSAEMKQLNGLALKLGKDTKFSAGEAAQAMYELAAAGFNVKQTSKALPGVLSLAAASSIDLKDAAEISSNALRGFGLRASQSGHVADVMAAAVNRSSLEMRDLQYSMKYVGPIAHSTGQSFEDMTAAVAIMGNAGIKGSQAGTTLRRALVNLVRPSEGVTAGLDALGLSVEDLQGPKGLKPLTKLMQILRSHMEGLTKAQQNEALGHIFGVEALSGMLSVVDAGPAKLRKLSDAFQHSDGQAKKAAKTMQDNVAGSFEQLKGSAETLGITLFQKASPQIKKALGEATKDVNKFLTALDADKGFKSGDDLMGGIGRAFKASGIKKDIDGLHLGRLFTHALDAAIPVIAKGGAKIALGLIKGFADSFIHGDPLTRLALGAFFITKFVGWNAVYSLLAKRMGARVGIGSAAPGAPGAPGVLPLLGERGPDGKITTGARFLRNIAEAGRFLGRLTGAAVVVETAVSIPKLATSIVHGKNVAASVQVWAHDSTLGLAPKRPTLMPGPNLLDPLSSTPGVPGFHPPKADSRIARDIRMWRESLKAGTADLADLDRAAKAGDLGRMTKPQVDQLRYFAGGGRVVQTFHFMRHESVTSLHQLNKLVTQNVHDISTEMGVQTEDGQKAISINFGLALRNVDAMMDDGSISTRKGMREIRRLMETLSAQGAGEFSGNLASIVGTVRKYMARGGQVTRQGIGIIQRGFVQQMKLYGIKGNQAHADASARAFQLANGESSITNGGARGGFAHRAGFVKRVLSGSGDWEGSYLAPLEMTQSAEVPAVRRLKSAPPPRERPRASGAHSRVIRVKARASQVVANSPRPGYVAGATGQRDRYLNVPQAVRLIVTAGQNDAAGLGGPIGRRARGGTIGGDGGSIMDYLPVPTRHLARGGIASLNRVFPRHSLSNASGYTRIHPRQVTRIFRGVGFDPLGARHMTETSRGISGHHPGLVTSDGGIGLVGVTPTAAEWGPGYLESDLYHKMRALGGRAGMRNPIKNALMARFMFRYKHSRYQPWKGTRFLSGTDGGLTGEAPKLKGGASPAETRASREESRRVGRITSRDLAGAGRLSGLADLQDQAVEDFGTSYSHQERVNSATTEDLSTPDGRAQRTREVGSLIGIKVSEGGALIYKRRLIRKKAAHYERLIDDLRRELKRKGLPAKARERIRGRIHDYLEIYRELRRQGKLLGIAIADIRLDVDELKTGLAAEIAEAAPTFQDTVDAAIAQATLTPGNEDDIAAAGAAVRYAQIEYDQAVASRDPRRITQTAQALKAARDNPALSPGEGLDASLKGARSAMDDVRRELARMAALEAGGARNPALEATRTLADMIVARV